MVLVGLALLPVFGCASVRPPESPRVHIRIVEYMNRPQARTYQDPDLDLSQFRKYAFDYNNQENPLLEKELFKMLDKVLSQKGMIRDEGDPDMLITMNFYVGRKESYVPPKTITTTRIENVWSTGMFGMTLTGQETPVPIRESQTTPGYTEISFYKNIRVTFLDYAKLKGGEKPKTPPLLWIGEVESTGKDPDIRNDAVSMLGALLFGPYSRIKCGTVEMEGYLCDKQLIVQAVNAASQPPSKMVDIHVGDVVRTIHGVALADYINKNKGAFPTSVKGPYYVANYSDSELQVMYSIEGHSIELEVEDQKTKAMRKVLVQ